MSLLYSVTGSYTGSIQSGSFLDSNDTSLFYVSQSADIWFSLSSNDVIEISAFSTDDFTQEAWGVIDQDKTFQTYTLSYMNDLNQPTTYSYNQLVNPFTLYKNNSILLQPSSDLGTIGLNTGSYVVSYNFTRQMAGSISSSLTIKNISNTRTEVELIPSSGSGDIQYNAFCFQRFPISDVIPVLISAANGIQFDSIYSTMSELNQYQNGISYLQFVFSLTNDGLVVNFLTNLYQDYITYTSLFSSTIGTYTSDVTRIQGIVTYYTNYLLQNYGEISDFQTIRSNFITFVNTRLDETFKQFLNANDQGYIAARKFCYDFFVTYFYDAVFTSLQESYEDKYFNYFKNVLNFGNNEVFSILNNGYIDQRILPTDPLTLIIKLSTPLTNDIEIKDTCWVSNFAMVPYIFTTIIQSPVTYQSVTISPPNFGAPQNLINLQNNNVLYSQEDLTETSDIQNSISVNKKISELNVDYSDFYNFVVFSSAETRLSIFKNKMIQWTALSSSLVILNQRYNASLSSSTPYPYFSTEQSALNCQINDIIHSFDGYESYLFNGGNYLYNYNSGSFVNSNYVAIQDSSASLYDRNNRDSLMSNVPQYILNDSANQEYLTFLNMIGHHFDNIYIYIAAMPIERTVQNELSSSMAVGTLKEMLYSFGWDVDDLISSLDIDQVYLNSMNSGSYNALSGQQRLQTVWNRILVTLPGIYKTKGTLECVNYLLACYGLPSSMLSVREYGGIDFATDTAPTYILDEKTYMLTFTGVNDYISGPIPFTTQTVEFKFSVEENNSYYTTYKFFPLFTSIPYPYSSSAYANWQIGFYRTPGFETGQVIFQMGSGSSGAYITSSILPIFNGEIFSVMLRQNDPSQYFESITTGSGEIPLQYDLVVQRNENARTIFYSSSSAFIYDVDNNIFSQFGTFNLSNGQFVGTLDKLSIWDVPLSDDDFGEHVNDLNSYGYSGSNAFQNLYVRLGWDYPQNMNSGSNQVWIYNNSAYYAVPNYYVDQTFTTVNPMLYSASLDIIENNWQSAYPTGSVNIFAHNFPVAIGDAFSASFQGYPTCSWVSQSIYPYQFEELTYEQDMDVSKYGPGKYNNNKIKTLDYQLQTRLDPFNRSTSQPEITVSGESNQLAFFIDPQDSKNKDIVRYVGKNGIIQLIGDPSNLYCSKYGQLVNKNYEYNTNGNKRTYFNELLTIYKFYFDKSIFNAILNVLPARANAYTGIVIEPTLLERPKYQNRPITASVHIKPAPINNIYDFGCDAISANFNTDFSLINSGSVNSQLSMSNSLPPNYCAVLDFSYLADPIKIWPSNLENGYYPDALDNIQFGFYPDFEDVPRLWETASNGSALPSNYTTPIYGSVSHMNNNTATTRLMIGPDHGVNFSNQYFSGFNHGNHPIIYYMLKVWEKYDYYSKTGSYQRSSNVNTSTNNWYNYNGSYYYSGSYYPGTTNNNQGSCSITYDNPNANSYTSASTYLYKYIIVDERYMRNLIYFTDLVNLPAYSSTTVYDTSSLSYTYNSSINPPGGTYLHRANTFLKTPDQTVSNISASFSSSFVIPGYTPFYLSVIPVSQYFELVKGYPRNHYTHKMRQFSIEKHGTYSNGLFVKGQQTVNSTVNAQGINDGSYPVMSITVTNVNVVNNSNVIQNIPSSTSGQVTPTTSGTVISS